MIDVSNVNIKKKQRDTITIVKRELNILLEDKEIHGIPMLFIGNKIDLDGHLN